MSTDERVAPPRATSSGAGSTDTAPTAALPRAVGVPPATPRGTPIEASVETPTEALPVGSPAVAPDTAPEPAEPGAPGESEPPAAPDATVPPTEEPAAAWRPPARVRLALGVLTVVVGLAAAIVAGLVVVAPVESTTSTLTWPRAGDDPARPTPTTAFVVPYRPAELRVEVPCAALREAERRSGATTVLATTTSGATEGLVVRADGRAVQLFANGRSRALDVPASGDCTTRVVADTSGLRVTVGGNTAVSQAGEPVPEVFAVTTDLTGAPAEGLRLTARTPAWFDNAPTDTKSSLATLQVQLAAVALGLLVVLGVLDRGVTLSRPGGRGRGSRRSGPDTTWFRAVVGDVGAAGVRSGRRWTARATRALRRPRIAGLLAVDLGVVGGLAWWSIVGPMTDDDGFAAAIARGAGFGGPVSNYYRWFDASEAPFATSQQLLRLFAELGPDPLYLRTMSMLAGIGVWFLITRGVLRRGLGGIAGTTVTVRLLAAVALAVWWLPFDLSTRPEPLVALGVTSVLVLVLRAVAPDARHPRAALAAAAGLAGLTVTVAPSGLIGLAPFLLVAPRLGRVLRDGRAGAPGAGRVAETLAVVAGLGAVAVTVVFAAQSWHGLVVSTAVHQSFGPSQPWYAEWLRYSYLLGDDSWGSATKRAPVLLAIVLALPALALLARRGRAALGGRPGGTAEAAVLLGIAPAGLVLMAVTPSKWSHHFGSLAGFGAVSVVAVVVALARSARRADHDRVLRILGPVTTVGIAAAATVAFSGPNAWWGFTNAHVAWATGPVLPVADLWRWLLLAALAAVVVAVAVVVTRRGPSAAELRAAVVSAAAAATPAVLAVLVAATSAGVLVTSFGAAADPPPGTWSFGARNLEAARGEPACGLQDRVEVLTTADGGPLTPAGGRDGTTATLDGFVEQGGWEDPPPARPGDGDTTRDGRYAWGSRSGGSASSVGSMTSPWFTLPRPGDGQELAIGVSGRTADGAAVSLQFGRSSSGSATTATTTRRLTEPPAPERGYRGYAADGERERLQDQNRTLSDWRTLTVPASAIPAGTDRVRVVARDDRTDDQGWVAVTGPRLVDVTPLRDYLAERTPVVVDWAIAFGWPCLPERAEVTDGVAQAPGALITTPPVTRDPVAGSRTVDDTVADDVVPERWTTGTDGLVTDSQLGASFAGMRQAGVLEEVDTRLAGDPGRVWGRLMVPDYGDLETDAYDRRTTTTRLDGTEGDPPPERAPRSLPVP